MALTLAANASAQSPRIDVAAGELDGFGRVVLTFTGATRVPDYTARTINGIFVIQFATAAPAEIDQVPILIPGYVSVVRRDPDDLALRFALLRGVTVNTLLAGEKLFIDFLPPGWTGLPPGLPPEVVAELARRAEEALAAAEVAAIRERDGDTRPEVQLRVGRAPTFVRFRFVWNVSYEADFSRSGDTVTVTFNRGAELDLAAVRANPPDLLRDISAEETEAGLRVRLTLDRRVDVRSFRDGDGFVLDLTSEALRADAVAAADHDLTDDAAEIALAPAPEPEPEPAAAIGPRPGARAHLDDAAIVPAPDEPSIDPAMPEGRPAAPASASAASAKPIGHALRLAFPFADPTAAAVFKRGNDVWIVFDGDAELDLDSVRTALRSRSATLVEVAAPGARAMILRLREPELVSAAVDVNGWTVTIGDTLTPPVARLALERVIRPDGTRGLAAAYPEAGRVVELRDPMAGDRLFAVTGYGPPRGLISAQSFVELIALPSLQGLGLIALADELTVARDGEGVAIGSPEGLALSSGARPVAAEVPASRPARAGFIDLGRWDAIPKEEFSRTAQEMQASIAAADEAERPARRIDLAGFYLSRECGPEAIGLLRMAEQESPALASQLRYRIMLAAATVIAGRWLDGARMLADEAMIGDADMAVWRTIAAAGIGDWQTAAALAPVASTAVTDYPDFVQQDVLLAMARAGAARNDFGAANAALTQLARHTLSGDRLTWRTLLDGVVAEAEGQEKLAERAYRAAAAAGGGQVAAEAAFRLASLGYRIGLLSVAEAGAALDSLSVSWRGDAIELNTLGLLADIQLGRQDYRAAFLTMRAAVAAIPGARETQAIQSRMNAAFERLFLDGGADTLPPIEALALYYDFRELTPVGRRGDAMVRKLADRLMAVDLIDQAADLLQYQVDERLRGAARAQIASDLAVIYLLDRKPQHALQVLRRTDQAELPATLDRQRRLVEARALVETGNARSALELLATMGGDDVDRLRVEALWKARDWRAVGGQIERMYGSRWSDPQPLEADERSDILRAAIGYALAGDEFGLERLRAKYQDKMADSPDRQAFETVTLPVEAQGTAFRDVVEQLAALDTLDAFLADYRQRYLAGPAPTATAEDSAARNG